MNARDECIGLGNEFKFFVKRRFHFPFYLGNEHPEFREPCFSFRPLGSLHRIPHCGDSVCRIPCGTFKPLHELKERAAKLFSGGRKCGKPCFRRPSPPLPLYFYLHLLRKSSSILSDLPRIRTNAKTSSTTTTTASRAVRALRL